MPAQLQVLEEMNKAVVALREGLESKAGADVIEKIQTAIDNLEIQQKQMSTKPAFETKAGGYSDVELKRAEAFGNLMRSGVEAKEIQEMMAEYKAMSGGVPADGGVLIPQILSDMIIAKMVDISPMRQVATAVTIGIGNELQIPRETGLPAGGWIGDVAARPATATSQMDLVKIALGECYANAPVTANLLEDQAFGLEAFVAQRIAAIFAQMEGAAFVSGDGVNKPTGFLNGAGAAGNVGVVKSGLATTFGFDSIFDLIYALNGAYAQNASFMAKRTTIKTLRTLKDTTNNYLWQPSNIIGQPATLAGYPIREAEDMPSIAADAFVLGFGDWRQGYTIVDKRGITMLRDPFTNKPFVNFYATKRVGGKVSQPDAIKVLQCKV